MHNQLFHPTVAEWFDEHFAAPTPAQLEAWPAIQDRQHVLIAAPTGSGKTLAAFLAAIDGLVRQSLSEGLADETAVLYVSPLKALSNDIEKNLQEPLQGITEKLQRQQLPAHDIRTAVRSGDTPQGERAKMRAKPPHILVTTPESLFILLTSDSGRHMLSTVKTVIVDEIHALASNKRGTHLSLSLERLRALTAEPPVRIGLSATQKPVDEIARFLTNTAPCTIVDTGHVRERDLAIEVPRSPLEAVMSNEIWQEIYDRLETLIDAHKTTLIFVNTRRLAERAARFLAERLGEENVTSHHGSLSKEHRLNAEQRLKRGELKALVATASLELGIDIGDIDLVCQIGSPRSIAAMLQRVGRSGHQVGALPKGRLFPLSRDDLLECTALLRAVQQNELDQISVPTGHLDVLCQQIIAEVACREWQEDELYPLIRCAWPYRHLPREEFDEAVAMLVEGFSSRRGRQSRYLHRDAVSRILKPRPGAKLTAVTNGGVIPDMFDYDVVLEPAGHIIGSLNEDFAFESLPGDIFQLGNTSYRILKVEQGKVRVEDAHGQPPNIPFWFGEAPGRSDILSRYVSQLRQQADKKLSAGINIDNWLTEELGLPAAAAVQLSDYLRATHAALGCIPSQRTIVFERFFDEVGDQHLVIHSPYGSRINRAWGLGLRKRFCRQFNFELQAAALDDSIVLSLGATHSFPLEDVIKFVRSRSIRDVVIQAMLAAPMFMTHWRWNATTALALKRNHSGKRIPATFQRMNAEDLMAVVFPDQLACQENLGGEREVPKHPLVDQTIADCLHDVMDIDGLIEVLKKIESGTIQVRCVDLKSPSPLAHEILNARPYAFLDDAPAEERRTLAVVARRFADPEHAADLAHLDPKAIEQVCLEAWPAARNVEECHDALMMLACMTDAESAGNNVAACDYRGYLQELLVENRVTRMQIGSDALWVCAERLAAVKATFPDAMLEPVIEPAGYASQQHWSPDEALVEIVRARLECLGPTTEDALCAVLESDKPAIETALLALENEGFAMQGNFRQHDSRAKISKAGVTEWCERGLLARMNRYTIRSLREEVKPVSTAEYMQFLFSWHGMGEVKAEGEEALLAAINRLEGFPIPAAAWEADILPMRIKSYFPSALDRLCSNGRLTWMRHAKQKSSAADTANKAGLLRNTPVVLINRQSVGMWRQLAAGSADSSQLSSSGQKVLGVLQSQGASFFTDIAHASGLLEVQAEDALAELAALGWVTSDNFVGLRALITPVNKRGGFGSSRRRKRGFSPASRMDEAGRWALIAQARTEASDENKTRSAWLSTDKDTLNHIASILLKRYGVVFRKVLERESRLPPWRELLYAYRRMEARGEIRGGRFVDGFGGEQFALPEAVGLLRKQRATLTTKTGQARTGSIRGANTTSANNAESDSHSSVVISACDPLNLVGIILPGKRIAAQAGTRILFKAGSPVALQTGKDVQFLEKVDEKRQWEIQGKLVRRRSPAESVDSLR